MLASGFPQASRTFPHGPLERSARPEPANKPAPTPGASAERRPLPTRRPPCPRPLLPQRPPRPPSPTSAAPRPARQINESLIAADLTIEGKIHGTGHVRIAGQFKGDVNVEGDLTIEKGAKLTGGVRAQKITIAGELEGNIEAAQRVDLLETGVLTGDVKAALVHRRRRLAHAWPGRVRLGREGR